MTTCLSHNHPLFQNYNTLFYGILEEDVRGNIYEANIKPFQRTNDGSGACKALMAHHAGKHKCIFVLRYANSYVKSIKWNGNTSFTLQNHADRCRADYVDIKKSAMHVPEQIPN